jgi:hypothetical protein
MLVAILQLPSLEAKMISETAYDSLKSLEPLMRLVDPQTFDQTAQKCGLIKLKKTEIPLKSGKKFLVSYYQKGGG